MKSWTDLHDEGATTPASGDANSDKAAPINSSVNAFQPAGFLKSYASQFPQSASKSSKCALDSPAWEEVTKRYQDIIERENKLLRSFPLYLGGQMPSLAACAPQAKKALSIPRGDENKEELSLPPSMKGTHVCGVAREDICDVVSETVKDKCLPKILEVFSLNSSKPNNAVIESRKRKNPQGLTHDYINEIPSTDVAEDVKLTTSKRSCAVPCDFIDLTMDDDDEASYSFSETSVSTAAQAVCVNGNMHSEQGQSRKSAQDKGLESRSSKCKVPKSQLVNEQKRNFTSTNTELKELCNAKSTFDAGRTKSEVVIDKDYECLGENNKCDKKVDDTNRCPDSTGDCKNVSYQYRGVDNGSKPLRLKNRESKITDLKALLARQEEELARLKTVAKYKAVTGDNKKKASRDTELKDNLKIEFNNDKVETTIAPVNLEDICQHVLKSFDIFNARQRKGKEISGDTDPSDVKKIIGSSLHGHVSEQDNFLSQLGLRRKISGLS